MNFFIIRLTLFLFFLSFSALNYAEELPLHPEYLTQPLDEYCVYEYLKDLPYPLLKKMQRAGKKALYWEAILNKTNDTVVSQITPKPNSLEEFIHYPEEDIYDQETLSQYYYHTHRSQEHGHFHLFHKKDNPNKESCSLMTYHLFAVSMNEQAEPIKLFTTNNWVTGEECYLSYEEIISGVNNFCISHANPSWPTNQWINCITQLFYPQIVTLIGEKQEILNNKISKQGNEILEDKQLEIVTEIPVSIEVQLNAIELALKNYKSPPS